MSFDLTKDRRKLDHEEMQFVLKVVRKRRPGIYILKTLFEGQWDGERRKQAFGRWFRASVLVGDVPGVRWVRQRSNKSHEYEVLAV